MARAAALALLAAVALAGVSAAAPRNDYLLVLGERAGPYRYLEPRAYEAAVTAFGRPSRFSGRSNLCRVTWNASGITVGFASMPPACARRNLVSAAWYGMSLHGPRWHNRLRVRVGDPVAKVRRVYPHARLERPTGTPWLVLVRRKVDEFDFIVLAVSVDPAGRVRSIEVPAGYIY